METISTARFSARPPATGTPVIAWLLGFFCFVSPGLAIVSSNAMVPLLLAVTLPAVFLHRWAFGRFPRPDPAVGWAVLALLVWAGAASFWSFDPGRAFVLTFRLAALLFAGLLLIEVARRVSPPARAFAMRAFVAGVAVAGLIMLSEWASDLFLLRLVQGVPAGEVLPPEELNRQSINIVLALWPMLVWLCRDRRFPLAAAVAAPAVVAVCLLASLAAIVALGVGTLFFLLALSWPRVGRAAVLVTVTAAVLGSVPIARTMHDLEVQRIQGIDGSSAEHRIEIWRYVVGLIERRPLLGWGFDSSRHLQDHEETRFTGPERVIMSLHPHNGPIQVWLELGIPGVVAAFVVSLLAVRRANRYDGISLAGAHGLFGATLLVACISFGIWQNQWLAAILSMVAVLALAAGERPPPDDAGRGGP